VSTPALDPFRLPRTALPRRYAITLEPDLVSGVFTGVVDVEFEVVDDHTREVVLNAIDLQINSVTIDRTSARFELDTDTERLHISASEPLTLGTHSLGIAFEGVLNDKLRGFYRSTYRDAHGDEQVIATTQMQSTDCRRAFPCWDEPDFKAVFAVTLVIDEGLTAISNSPEIGRSPAAPRRDGGAPRVAITFADTMVMSSYLVAFVVGRLEATQPVDVDGIALRVVHVPGKSHLSGFGLEVAEFCLRWFREYYDIDYPGDKVDLVALPDFAAGAMENLGCITFRENLLLVDPETATHLERQLVADVVSHELAHMWFGDLVTMRWWNGIWLNEAFATFMEIAATDAFRPDWQRWVSFGLERSMAFETDSLSSTRSVEYDVRSPAECEGMFDVLTYQKGGALLRMLEQHLGPERFRDGIRHYLTTHSYANTETEDLWDAIEATTGEPVRRMMDSWIWQRGYPLVTARIEGDELVLSQQRFRFAGAGEHADDHRDTDTTHWLIPVAVRNGDATISGLLEGDELRMPLADPAAVVVVNAGGHGYWRVAYDDRLRSRLSGAALQALDTLERYNLVDDAYSALLSGAMSSPDFLGFVEGFSAERDYSVWQSIITALRTIGRILDDDAYPAFQRRVAALVGPVVAELGDHAPDEDHARTRLRGLLVGAFAVLGGDAPTQARCRSIIEHPGAHDADLVAAATTVVAATGGHDEYEWMLERHRNATTPQDELRHLQALAEFDDAELIARTCEFAMSSRVKTQTAPFLLRMCIANRRHGDAAWRFVRERWEEANQRFPSNTIVRMVESVKMLTTAEQVRETRSFFETHPIEQATETLRQILERQQVNHLMREREASVLAEALATR